MFVSEMMKSNMHDYCIMERHHEPDGEGGSVTRWEEGLKFSAATAHDTTIMAQTAEAQDTASTYTLLIPVNLSLAFPDVIKRLDSGETFQITTNSGDLKTPETSRLQMRAVKARKLVLP